MNIDNSILLMWFVNFAGGCATAFCKKRYKFSLFGNYNCSFCGGFIVVIITLCCVSWSGNGWKSFRVFYHADILYGACVIPFNLPLARIENVEHRFLKLFACLSNHC